jgi:hypothetical protein
MSLDDLTDEQRRALNFLRLAWPGKAAEIETILARTDTARRGDIKIDVKIKYRLEKFDGDYEPGKQPFEVIEGADAP